MVYEHGVGDLADDFALVYDVVRLFGLDDVVLFHGLDAEYGVVLLAVDELDFAEGAGAEEGAEAVVGHLEDLLDFLFFSFHGYN